MRRWRGATERDVVLTLHRPASVGGIIHFGLTAIGARPQFYAHAQRPSRHHLDVPTVAIAARTRHAGTERTGVSALAVALQRPVAVIFTHPTGIVAEVAGHSGLCILPSNQPMPTATMAVVYGCVSIVRRNHCSSVAAVS